MIKTIILNKQDNSIQLNSMVFSASRLHGFLHRLVDSSVPVMFVSMWENFDLETYELDFEWLGATRREIPTNLLHKKGKSLDGLIEMNVISIMNLGDNKNFSAVTKGENFQAVYNVLDAYTYGDNGYISG